MCNNDKLGNNLAHLADDKQQNFIYLSVEETADLLRINRNTLYDAIKRGEVPGVRRIGRVIRICRAAVLEWFRGNGPGTPAIGDDR